MPRILALMELCQSISVVIFVLRTVGVMTVCHNNNGCMVSLISKATTSDPKPNGPKRDVSESQRKQLEALLKDCQDKIREEIEQSNLNCLFTSIDPLTCFSNSLTQDVITKYEQLYSGKYLCMEC